MKRRLLPLGACALVAALFLGGARSGVLESLSPGAAETYYNLLVRGFRAGRLSVDREAPAGLASLADPYDPAANAVYRSARYRLHDISYYRGRLYLYFGVTPALVLFWPYAALTGRYLYHREAAAIFCSAGFLAGAAVLLSLRRRYFPTVGSGVAAAALLALGLASGWPLLLARAEVYEVAIAGGSMFVFLGLAAMTRSLHATGWRQSAWLAAASLAGGLAVGARPSLLLGVPVLLLPAWRGRAAPVAGGARPAWPLVLAALVPIACCGVGLALYNYERFGQWTEFGLRYQLSGVAHQELARTFGAGNFWFNFRVYFLAPIRWSRSFPFVVGAVVPPLPAGRHAVEDPFGILFGVPLVGLALAAPLAWRGRPPAERALLRGFALAVAWLAGTAILVAGFLNGSCSRYEIDFLPELVLLAALGIFGLERALSDRVPARRAVRWVWGLLLAWSVAFNLLAAVEHTAEARCDTGIVLLGAGRPAEAVEAFRAALRAKPDYVDAHVNLGVALSRLGRPPEAIAQDEAALRLAPDNLPARINLGTALAKSDRWPEAVVQYRQALRLDPANADVHYNLAAVLELEGRPEEARAERAEADRLERRP